jgi:hypothetical protein
MGRDEATTHENGPIRSWVSGVMPRVRWLWKYRYGKERASEIESWNVVRLRGPFRRWDKVGFEEWLGFGTVPFPVLSRSFYYQPLLDRVDLVEIKPAEAWILHDVHLLMSPPVRLPKEKKKGKAVPAQDPVLQRQRYLKLSEGLRSLGVVLGDRTKTRRMLDAELAKMGKEVVGWDIVDRPSDRAGLRQISL